MMCGNIDVSEKTPVWLISHYRDLPCFKRIKRDAYIEGLLLVPLQAEPTANISELQEALKREKKRIETLETQRRQQHIQRRITDFLVLLGGTATTSASSAP